MKIPVLINGINNVEANTPTTKKIFALTLFFNAYLMPNELYAKILKIQPEINPARPVFNVHTINVNNTAKNLEATSKSPFRND